MGQRITQVDAFTGEAFSGNPAAVCVLDAPGHTEWMQAVAREMNLSETAFLHPHGDAFDLRWFTPAVEVDLCGHATLASAHVLWSEGHLPPDRAAVFHTRSGVLTCELEPGDVADAVGRGDAPASGASGAAGGTGASGAWIRMDFPAQPPEAADAPAGLVEALGAGARPPRYVGRNKADVLVELESEDLVRSLHPDIQRLGNVAARGIIVTARAEGGPWDFVSRFFAPRVGVAEDPVTGSAHVCLGPYWAERLGRTDLLAYQASARGGILRVGVRGERVLIGGQAVTVLRGELLA